MNIDLLLPDSELRFRLLADSIPLIVWTANPDGELDYYNRQWEIYTGYSAESTKGWGWAPILHPDDLQPCIDRWTQAFTSGESYEIEYRFKRASDGSYRWHLGRAIPLRDETGTIIKWFGTGTDIDDQIRARELLDKAYTEIESVVKVRTAELAQANQMLVQQDKIRGQVMEALKSNSARLNEIITTQYMLAKAALDLDAFFTLVVDRMANLTSANGVVVEMVEGDEIVCKAANGTAAEFIGLRLRMGTSLSGLSVTNNEVLICNETETDPRVNLQACRKVKARSMVVAPLIHVGKPVGVLKIMGPVPDAFNERDIQTLQLMAGLIGAALGHQADHETNCRLLAELTEAVTALKNEISHRIIVEEAIRDHELRTRMIIDSSYDAFIAINANGIIVDWNKQAEIIFGWSKNEAVGSILADIIIPQRFRDAHINGMKRFNASGVGDALDNRIELVGLRKNGEEFPVELTIRAIQLKQGFEFCAFLRDITDRKNSEHRLLHLAQNDQLTGIPNRSLFNDRIVEAMKRSKRTQSLMALMYLDIDHFKSVNDTYGHIVGDGLLIEFTRRLRSSVRTSDTVARLGGDEFTIIMEDLKSHKDATIVANKVLLAIQEPMMINDIALEVTTSIGIAFYYDAEMDPDHLVINADKALYHAKEAGRNRFST